MARARNIKPAIMDNEDLSDFSPMTRLLFVYLWMLADREGRLEDRPKRIGARAFPYDRSADVDAMLDELASGGFIKRYEADGVKVIQINSFLKHQTPHGTEKDSVLPNEHGKYTVHKRQKNGYATGETSLNDSPSTVKDVSDNCVLTVKKLSTNTLNPDSPNPDSLIPDSLPSDEGKKPRAKRKPEPNGSLSVPDLVSEGVDERHAIDWMRVRKDKGAKSLTQTAWLLVKTEAAKLGMSPAQAVEMAAANSWRGFHADWVKPANSTGPARHLERPLTPSERAAYASAPDICNERVKRLMAQELQNKPKPFQDVIEMEVGHVAAISMD